MTDNFSVLKDIKVAISKQAQVSNKNNSVRHSQVSNKNNSVCLFAVNFGCSQNSIILKQYMTLVILHGGLLLRVKNGIPSE